MRFEFGRLCECGCGLLVSVVVSKVVVVVILCCHKVVVVVTVINLALWVPSSNNLSNNYNIMHGSLMYPCKCSQYTYFEVPLLGENQSTF
mgnify:FL=1